MRNAKAQKVKPIYEKTKDVRRMLTHKLLNEAIRNDWENVKRLLPARTATNLRYDKGSKKAAGWDEGGKEEIIDLPLRDGWYLPDGNPFDIPNGKSSNKSDPDALYLVRYQDRSFNGPVGRDYDDFGFDGRRSVDLVDRPSFVSGVAFVERKDSVPLISVSEEKLVEIADPKALLEKAELLEAMAKDFDKRFGGMITADMHQKFVTEPLETAKILREVAGKIEAGMKN